MFIAQSLLEAYYAKEPKKLEADLKVIATSSVGDDQLFEWLIQDDDVWPALGPVFERRINTRKGFAAWLLEADRTAYRLTANQKRIGAFFVILELREFAGHSLWNRVGKSPHYEEILKRVHSRVAERFNAPNRGEMSIEDRELSLSSMILRQSLEQLSPEVVAGLLRDAQFESTSDLKELRNGLMLKLSSSGIGGMKSLLGKSVAKRIGAGLIESAWGASRLAQAGKVGSLASKVLPLALKRAGLYVSIGFLLKDAYQLGGEATRVTNPAVIIIALYRSFSGK